MDDSNYQHTHGLHLHRLHEDAPAAGAATTPLPHRALPSAPSKPEGLYAPEFEHDACGVGFVADMSGRQNHEILRMAVQSVINLTHRGAVDADGKSGDGAGITTQVPQRLFARELERLGHRLPANGGLAVGMIFLPRTHPAAAERAQAIIEETLARYGLAFFGWRVVPLDLSALGQRAAESCPDIQQALVGRPETMSDEDYQRALYLARKEIEARVQDERIPDFYIPSFSNRTLVYKGLLVAPQLANLYLDLQDPLYETALALFHQRYSTNTFPNWFLAQPFRTLGHNGEINTLQGNRHWIAAREQELRSKVWGEQVASLRPIIQPNGSDSANLDNVAELLMLSGRDIRQVMMMLVPEAWENMPNMDPAWRAFYEYHACLTEPWDGPAALAFTDGLVAAACLDRNGLRPARYKVLDNGIVIMASEVGVIEVDDAHVVEKGRLGPGHMIAVDTVHHVLQRNEDIKEHFARQQYYEGWLQEHLYILDDHVRNLNGHALPEEHADVKVQKTVGFTVEELNLVMKPMVLEKKEPTWSMGDDTAVAPLAVLSVRPRPIYSYFKQKFAQVTNPPIDPLREELVTSLYTYVGRRGSLLEEEETAAKLVRLSNPFLLNNEVEALRHLPDPAFRATTLSVLFHAGDGPEGLAATLDRVCAEAEAAVDDGSAILILSDRGIDEEHVPVPMLLAVGAVHHHLIRQGKRMRASIVAETAEAWEVHHFSALLGYGASAFNPYMAFAIIRDLVDEGETGGVLDYERAVANYKTTISKGILKVMSKMGISAVTGYQGAQIFEAIGLGDEAIDRCFTGTTSWVGGIGLYELGQEAMLRHSQAYVSPRVRLDDVGYYRFRKTGEHHAFNPFMVRAMQKAVNSGKREDYDQYVRLASMAEVTNLRDLLDFTPGAPIPLDDVESVESVVRRFTTGAMSLGALSPEAHQTFARAMNVMGAKSNTGEGGEDQWRFQGRFGPRESLENANTAIKQVASGRFGVTPEYLASAEELEIKMAQGSKPGEGGQLPGHKVVEHIAVIRHTIPGVTLISPPPHHDIYSIEDLAQLIYDLKQASPRARITVKLVSEAGVGTIAAGVAKAYADGVHVSGNEGGTGASPLSSIKNAGSPWELGLAETQQVLVRNDLRGRVKLRTDGGFRSGRDVVIAAMLGADEYAFGTSAMVAIGCDMARQCHLNTCPTGIATQRADLRAKYTGTTDQVITYFRFIAQEVREILASLGARSLEEVIGRTDLLRQREIPGHPKANTLDLAALLHNPDPEGSRPRRRMQDRNDRPGDVPLNRSILAAAMEAIETKGRVQLSYPIKNVDRTVGAMVAGEIAYRYGDNGLPEGSITVNFTGSAGQSFGAFNINGVRLDLTGEANDYVGKGMHGGEIVIRPFANATYETHKNVIVGNTCLYGATGGYLFAAGRAGERFAVRNSGARAVVEGVGDHGCEYMTGGVVVVLGETGRNFGAGMAGGLAFVLDEQNALRRNYNPEMVTLEKVDDPEDIALLRSMVERHLAETGSPRAQAVLDQWDAYLSHFWKLFPHPPVEGPGPRTPGTETRVPARS